jgi:LmbE family N-acetylglucosaminyl deacetylase
MTNALAVVAHHDDHILWMGGMIQRMRARGWNWTLVALCVPDPERRAYFVECCRALGAESLVMDFADHREGPEFGRNDREEMRSELLHAVQGRAYDFVFTHSRDGQCEYGFHANHRETQTIVTELVANGAIGTGPQHTAYFHYAPMFDRSATTARRDDACYLQLSYAELLHKCLWCAQAPDMRMNLADLKYPCPNPEAFTGDGLRLPDPDTGQMV